MDSVFCLNTLIPSPRSNPKRRGRGIGSGLGKTSGYGHKGGKARSGRGKVCSFEGGQMPLYRRLPKRGFNSLCTDKGLAFINVGVIQTLIDSGKINENSVLDLQSLINIGAIKSSSTVLRVLGSGDISSPVNVVADHFSASAVSAIERVGGKITKVG